MSLDSSAGSDTNHSDPTWSVECSDEESYFEPSVPYRTGRNATRTWEPSGENIIRLYDEIEAKGFNKLEWQCPGRISPSDLTQDNANSHYSDSTDVNSLINGCQTKSKFDFDNDFDDDKVDNSNTRVTKRSQVTPKSQTNLSKVMLNIKKYQMIGQKTKVKPNATTCPPSIAIPSMSTTTSTHINSEAKSANSTNESNQFDSEEFDFPN